MRAVLSWTVFTLTTMAALEPVPSQAQEQDESRRLDEVIVTARRRDENLQQVPISIEALSGETMELRGMERIENVIAQTPNVMTTNFGPAGTSNFSIRGIPNVGVFVDGIWQQSPTLLNERATVELERIEILRGPQGTLYGRDTTGGAIRLFTKKPSEEFGTRATVTAGSYDRFDANLAVDFPITDTLFSKFTGIIQNRDGYVDSLVVDRSYGEIDNQMLRGDLLWTPRENFEARLIFEDSLMQTTAPMGSIVVMDPNPPGPSPGFGAVVPPRQYYELLGYTWNNLTHAAGWPGGQVGEWENKSDFNEGHGTVVDSQAWTAILQYTISDSLTVTSWTGWRDEESHAFSDFDSSEFQMFSQQAWNKRENITQELQLAGTHERFRWTLGGFYFDTENQARQMRWGQTDIDAAEAAIIRAAPQCNIVPPPRTPPGCRVPGFPNTDTFTGFGEEGWAVFGELTFDITEALSLTVGARYHDQDNPTWSETFAPDTPRRSQITVPGRVIPGDYFGSLGRFNEQTVNFHKDTYRFALTYQLTDDQMVYFGYSEGFNSGDIERVTVVDGEGVPHQLDFPLDPEQIENYELGFRSDWLDDTLRFNATVFFTKWLNMQQRLQIKNPFTGAVLPNGIDQNVAESEAKGAELTLASHPTENLTFDVGLGLLDTKYTKIDEGVTSVNLNDSFGLAPELQWNVGVQWDDSLASGAGVTARVDYAWTDDYIRSYNPDTQIKFNNPGFESDQESFGLLNARVAYTAPSRKWEVAAFGTNLTNEFYLTGGFNPAILAVDFGAFGRPREYGMSFKIFME